MQCYLDAEPKARHPVKASHLPEAHRECSNIRNIMPNDHADRKYSGWIGEKGDALTIQKLGWKIDLHDGHWGSAIII
jgi:hypothetical protein